MANKKRRSTKRPVTSRSNNKGSNRSKDNYEREANSAVPVNDTEKGNTFGGNSIEWYSRYPNLLLGAGQIPYPYKPGMRVPMGDIITVLGDEPDTVYDIIPGILRIDWRPSVGLSLSPTSPISIVGKEVYAKVREKFSGAIDADAPDFIVYLMALDSIFSYIAMLKRIYRVLNAYSPDNLFTPDGILNAMGFSATQIADLREHKMEFYQRINELVLMTYKFKCPRIMDVFNRHVWLNDHIYTDAPTPNSQFYMFWQITWYKFAMVDIPHSTPTAQAGGLIEASPWNVPGLNTTAVPASGVASYLFNFGRSLIDALAASDDGYLISGYLMRAYDGIPDFRADELLLGEFLIPKYNEEVLGEIENLHTLPSYETSYVSNTIAQDPSTNAIIAEPIVTFPISSYARTANHVGMYPRFNARVDSPTIAQTVVNSRLMTYTYDLKETSSTEAQASILCCTEIVEKMMMFIQHTVGGAPARVQKLASDIALSARASSGLTDSGMETIFNVFKLMQWDWAPILVLQVFTQKGSYLSLVGDVHNFTSCSIEALRNINTVCLYSLFNAFNA